MIQLLAIVHRNTECRRKTYHVNARKPILNLTTGRLDVRYKGPQAGGGESVGQLEPLQDGDSFDRSPQNSESDVQFDHFMPFTHYLSKRQAVSAFARMILALFWYVCRIIIIYY